jgi:hypothetical protein
MVFAQTLPRTCGTHCAWRRDKHSPAPSGVGIWICGSTCQDSPVPTASGCVSVRSIVGRGKEPWGNCSFCCPKAPYPSGRALPRSTSRARRYWASLGRSVVNQGVQLPGGTLCSTWNQLGSLQIAARHLEPPPWRAECRKFPVKRRYDQLHRVCRDLANERSQPLVVQFGRRVIQ